MLGYFGKIIFACKNNLQHRPRCEIQIVKPSLYRNCQSLFVQYQSAMELYSTQNTTIGYFLKKNAKNCKDYIVSIRLPLFLPIFAIYVGTYAVPWLFLSNSEQPTEA